MADADGFLRVTRKRRTVYQNNVKPISSNVKHEKAEDLSPTDRCRCIQRINLCRQELEISNYIRQSLDVIEHALTTVDGHIEQLVCYGLGNFTSCLIARYQMAFLLCLRDRLQVPGSSVHVYDPLFSNTEIELLSEFDLTPIDFNEEGKRCVLTPSLFYMPHCGSPLYNNLLWKNWGQETLSHLVVIGNNFSGISERISDREFKEQYSYIYKILPYCEERMIDNNFKFDDIFNNTAVHTFPAARLKSVPQEIWKYSTEPSYPKDVEIIQTS